MNIVDIVKEVKRELHPKHLQCRDEHRVAPDYRSVESLELALREKGITRESIATRRSRARKDRLSSRALA